MGGDEDVGDVFIVDERRASRIFLTVESLFPLIVGPEILLFKLERKVKWNEIDLKWNYESIINTRSVCSIEDFDRFLFQSKRQYLLPLELELIETYTNRIVEEASEQPMLD